MTLQDRVIRICKERNIPEDHIKIYLDNLTPVAILHDDQITDNQINNTLTFQELFWGLGDAVMNYLKWEQTQH